jgi:hypothetical protein
MDRFIGKFFKPTGGAAAGPDKKRKAVRVEHSAD